MFLRPVLGQTTVIVSCGGCEDYLRMLADMDEEFQLWEARLIVLRADRDRVVVADRYGQVFYTDDALTAPRQLAEWLKYLGTLCPE